MDQNCAKVPKRSTCMAARMCEGAARSSQELRLRLSSVIDTAILATSYSELPSLTLYLRGRTVEERREALCVVVWWSILRYSSSFVFRLQFESKLATSAASWLGNDLMQTKVLLSMQVCRQACWCGWCSRIRLRDGCSGYSHWDTALSFQLKAPMRDRLRAFTA